MYIIIRTATTNEAEEIAKIKIEGWQTAYRGIIDDKFLDNMDINEELEKRKNKRNESVWIIKLKDKREL